MPGEAGEGQPKPLNPQARADINEALAKGGADQLKTPKDNSPESYFSKRYLDLRFHLKKLQESHDREMSQLPELDKESTDENLELGEVRNNAGVFVNRFKYEGPSVINAKEISLGRKKTHYEGFTINTPDRRIAVFKGPLSGATFVKEFDDTGKEISVSTFYGGMGDLLSKAADIYPPNELPHLIDATVKLSKSERERLSQGEQSAGRREQFLLQEAQRLVSKGQYSDITKARAALISKIEVRPSTPEAENTISDSINRNELPQDITDQEEAKKIMQELDFSSKNPAMAEDFARKFPGLIRIGTMSPEEKARFAFSLAQNLTESVLGKNGRSVRNVSFENARQLSQIQLDATSLGGNRASGVIDILNYTWDKVVSLQSRSGLPSGRPRLRII